MKIKPLVLLPGAIAVLFAAAAPLMPMLTHGVVAQAAPGARPNRADKMRGGRAWQELNLTDAQKAQMKQVRESAKQRMDTILTSEQKAQLQAARQQRQRPNLNLTEAQKAQMKAVREDTQRQIEAILTPEQRQKLQEIKQQRGQRSSQRRQLRPAQ